MSEGVLIGGTANTAEQIIRLKKKGADYAGCGPFRFTTTKEKLAPTLGLEGYRHILQQLHKAGIRLPVCAIGGIEPDDVLPLLETGVQGIAVSGAVLRDSDPAAMMQRLLHADDSLAEQA